MSTFQQELRSSIAECNRHLFYCHLCRLALRPSYREQHLLSDEHAASGLTLSEPPSEAITTSELTNGDCMRLFWQSDIIKVPLRQRADWDLPFRRQVIHDLVKTRRLALRALQIVCAQRAASSVSETV